MKVVLLDMTLMTDSILTNEIKVHLYTKMNIV